MLIDSIHGEFKGNVDVNEVNNALIINDTTVHIINVEKPEDMDYTKYDIFNALVTDNIEAFRDKEWLSKHLNQRSPRSIAYHTRKRNYEYDTWR
jgi:glyceraldehyde 3-phosphate dehydrogenase